MKLTLYVRLIRLHKPIGIFLLLWPTLWALWIAGQGRPAIKIILIFIAGVILMRSAGCIINDIADRNFDAHVTRTRERPLVTGIVTIKGALILFTVLVIIAFLLVLQLNAFTIALSFVAVILAIIYPFTKRFSQLPQFVLGAAFAWSVPMAFAAQLNAIPNIAWLVFVIALLWPVMYDTLYAMVDREDDILIGIKSTAILFGKHDRWVIGLLQLIIISLFLLLGFVLHFTIAFYFAVLLATILFCYQQYLIKDRIPAKCFQAFLNNNWVGLIIFVGIVVGQS
jgi:4-hydroxybenzoate polyprenyltransferase